MIARADMERLRRRQRAFARAVVYFLFATGISLLFAIVCWAPPGGENTAFADLHAHLDARSHLGGVGAPFVESAQTLTLAGFLQAFGWVVFILLGWLLYRRLFCFAALVFGLLLVTLFAGHVHTRALYYHVAYNGTPAALVAASDAALGADVRANASLRAITRYVAAQRAYLDGDARGVHHWLSQAPFDVIPFSDAMPWRYMAMHEYAHAHGFTFADDARANRGLAAWRPSVMRGAALWALGVAFLLTCAACLCSQAGLRIAVRIRLIMADIDAIAGAPA